MFNSTRKIEVDSTQTFRPNGYGKDPSDCTDCSSYYNFLIVRPTTRMEIELEVQQR